MSRCTSCDCETFDDPHFTDDGQVVCDDCCGCLLSDGGSDASLPRGVPAVGDPVLPGARPTTGETTGVRTAGTSAPPGHPAAERETAPAVER